MGSLILALLMAIPPGQESASIRVRVSLFEVPFMILSRTIAARVAEDGSVAGTMVVGSTTGAFPTGVVSLQNRLPVGSDSEEIKKAIREFMASDCIKAQYITINELARHEFVFDHQGKAGQEVYQELSKGRPSPVSYRVDIEPVWENEQEVGLAVQVWLRWQNPTAIQDIIKNIPERLALDQTVSVKFGQSSLVGFPSTTTGPRSIFWLAASVETMGAK